jgi:hypothetical protein
MDISRERVTEIEPVYQGFRGNYGLFKAFPAIAESKTATHITLNLMQSWPHLKPLVLSSNDRKHSHN